MKIYLLFTGEYEQRSVHSAHSSEAAAVSVYTILSRSWPAFDREQGPDIEDHELDAAMCTVCGYEEHWHIENRDAWKHAFQASDRDEQ